MMFFGSMWPPSGSSQQGDDAKSANEGQLNRRSSGSDAFAVQTRPEINVERWRWVCVFRTTDWKETSIAISDCNRGNLVSPVSRPPDLIRSLETLRRMPPMRSNLSYRMLARELPPSSRSLFLFLLQKSRFGGPQHTSGGRSPAASEPQGSSSNLVNYA
jgi:hypothetical protein